MDLLLYRNKTNYHLFPLVLPKISYFLNITRKSSLAQLEKGKLGVQTRKKKSLRKILTENILKHTNFRTFPTIY